VIDAQRREDSIMVPDIAPMAEHIARWARCAEHLVVYERCEDCREGWYWRDDPARLEHRLLDYEIAPRGSDRAPVLRANGRCKHGHALTPEQFTWW
jgi:hypothetical protein